jgi:septum site-determining protein MinC
MGKSAVIIKSNPYGLILNLNPDMPYEELCAAVAEKFRTSRNFFKNATMALTFRGRVLTQAQENQLIDEIVQNSGIHVVCLVDEQKESEAYYKEAVIRALEERKQEDGQFYRGTLRSGQVLETESSVVIIGDVNPGAQVISKGNIVILGCCMGNIYAGASGDSGCFAAALIMKPMQIRIADKTARSAIVKKVDTGEYPIDPKIVYIKEDHLQIKPITSENLSDYLN